MLSNRSEALSGVYSDTINYPSTVGFTINKAIYVANDSCSQSTPETNILFLFVNFIYLTTLVAFTLGQPWKKSVYTNKIFMVILTVVLTFTIVIVLVPEAGLLGFKMVFINDIGMNGFVLGLAFFFSLAIFIFQKAIW